MKRVTCIVLAGLCALGLFLSQTTLKVSAASNGLEESFEVIDGIDEPVRLVKAFDNGCKLYEGKVIVVQRTRATITAQKPYYQYDSNGGVLWSATVVGNFTYNGSTSSCTSASCSTTIYHSSWSEKSCSAYPSGNSAIGNVTMVRKLLFIVLETVPVTITLTCDKNGNLS